MAGFNTPRTKETILNTKKLAKKERIEIWSE